MISYTNAAGRIEFPLTRLSKYRESIDEPYNRQNLLAAKWGDESAQHDLVGFDSDRMERDEPVKYARMHAMMRGMDWKARAAHVLSVKSLRDEFLSLGFGDARIDYVEIIEFTNVQNGWPYYHVGAWALSAPPKV